MGQQILHHISISLHDFYSTFPNYWISSLSFFKDKAHFIREAILTFQTPTFEKTKIFHVAPSVHGVHINLFSSDWERPMWVSKRISEVSMCLFVALIQRCLHFLGKSFPFLFLFLCYPYCPFQSGLLSYISGTELLKDLLVQADTRQWFFILRRSKAASGQLYFNNIVHHAFH